MLLRLEIIQGLNCSRGPKFTGFSILQEMLLFFEYYAAQVWNIVWNFIPWNIFNGKYQL